MDLCKILQDAFTGAEHFVSTAQCCTALLFSLGMHDLLCFTLLSWHPWTWGLTNCIDSYWTKTKNWFANKKTLNLDYCVVISGLWIIPCYILGQGTLFQKLASCFYCVTWKSRRLIFCRPLGGSAAPSQPCHPEALWKRQPGLEQPLTKIFFVGKQKMKNQKPWSSLFPKQSFGSSAHSTSGNMYQNQYIMKS